MVVDGPTDVGVDVYVISLSAISEKNMVSKQLHLFTESPKTCSFRFSIGLILYVNFKLKLQDWAKVYYSKLCWGTQTAKMLVALH